MTFVALMDQQQPPYQAKAFVTDNLQYDNPLFDSKHGAQRNCDFDYTKFDPAGYSGDLFDVNNPHGWSESMNRCLRYSCIRLNEFFLQEYYNIIKPSKFLLFFRFIFENLKLRFKH